MENIFTYENWPYFFVAIIIFLILINMKRCHQSGKFLTLGAKEYADKRATVANIAQQVSEQTAAQIAKQVSEQVTEQTAAQVAARIAAQTTAQVLTENFAAKKPVIVYKNKANPTQSKIPKTFTENFKKVTVVPKSSVRRVAQRENFAPYTYDRKVEGVDMGAAGCSGGACTDCYKNLNDQINLGVNNYIFPNCNNDVMCLNGCNIQDQINNYQYDYRMGQSVTELERSRSGMYTSLNVDSCSQDCPSMGWMPPASTSRDAAAEYISTLVPVEGLKKK